MATDQNKIGEVHIPGRGILLKPCHGCTCACVILKIGNDMVTAAQRVMHSISSYSET